MLMLRLIWLKMKTQVIMKYSDEAVLKVHLNYLCLRQHNHNEENEEALWLAFCFQISGSRSH